MTLLRRRQDRLANHPPRRPIVGRSCILVAHVTVASERLSYTCVWRVRLRPSLSWTFPPQNSRGAASAAFFALGPVAISPPPSLRRLAGATPPRGSWCCCPHDHPFRSVGACPARPRYRRSARMAAGGEHRDPVWCRWYVAAVSRRKPEASCGRPSDRPFAECKNPGCTICNARCRLQHRLQIAWAASG
jgi:hypothetical protein